MTVKDKRSFKFWQELKRRNVPRVLAIYAGTACIILEAADIIFLRWGLTDRTVDLMFYLLLPCILVYPKIFRKSDSPFSGSRKMISTRYLHGQRIP